MRIPGGGPSGVKGHPTSRPEGELLVGDPGGPGVLDPQGRGQGIRGEPSPSGGGEVSVFDGEQGQGWVRKVPTKPWKNSHCKKGVGQKKDSVPKLETNDGLATRSSTIQPVASRLTHQESKP